MIISDDLFALIRSLSRSEKKYFKQYTTLYIREGGNTYLQLFDAINNQKEYNEKELIEQFKGFRFTKQFSVAKNFLYNRIMTSLEAYHSSVYEEVRSLIHRAEILYDKALYKQSLKIIRRAKKAATQYEIHYALLEIAHKWESNIALKQMNTKLHIKILNEGKKSLKQIGNDLQYASLSAKFVEQYFNYGKTKNRQHLKKMDAMIRNPFFRDPSKAKAFGSKIRFCEANIFYHSSLSDEKMAYKFTKKISLLFDRNPGKIRQHLVNYMVNLYNLIEVSISLKKLDEIPEHIEKLRSAGAFVNNKFLKDRFFMWYTSSILNYNNKTGSFPDTIRRLPAIAAGLHEYENTLQDIEKAALYSYIAVSFFATNNPAQCLFWLNKIRDELSLATNPDFQTENKFFYLVIHYEMKNTELLPYLVQSLYRYLIKKGRLMQFEKTILSFLKKQSSITDKKELLLSFRGLKKKLESLPEKAPFSHFNFIAWLESRIENKSFSEVVTKMAKQTSLPKS